MYVQLGYIAKMHIQRWQIGDCTLTSVVEDEVPRVPVQAFFPQASAADVARHRWLVPDYADEKGRLIFRVQAFVLELHGRRIVIDPCVGNAKRRELPAWNNKQTPFLERLRSADFAPDAIDTVIHTHLHADHVGWDTHFDNGSWVPTFTRARHLYTRRELEYRKRETSDLEDVYADSVAPILAAGLADIVDDDADLGDGLQLESTPGHTPGHVSLWLRSQSDTALVTGDFLHHPVQCAELNWAEFADDDADLARTTRRRMLERATELGALFVGTHFPTCPAGRLHRDGDVFRFVAEPSSLGRPQRLRSSD